MRSRSISPLLIRRVSRGQVQPVETAGTYGSKSETTKEINTMRFMVLIKADKKSEAGVLPTKELFTAMGKYNEELVNAGVLLAGEGLQPSSKGARVKFSAGKEPTVIDGPFAEAKELIAGFWLFQVNSKEEAIEWVKRCPSPMGPGEEAEIEIRQVFEAADFPADLFTPELAAEEEALRERLAKQTAKQ
jgi:hypothetical protein